MDLYRVGLPEDIDIIVRDKFIVDKINPFCIKKISDDQYSMLFYLEQHSTDADLFLQCIFKFDKDDEGFLNNHPLNIVNIQREQDRLNDYNDKISNMSGNVFNTDFDMEKDSENPRYFYCKAIKALNLGESNTKASLMDLYITRDNFIKISLFLVKFLKMDYSAEAIFKSSKINNLEFVNIEHIKLNGSCIDKGNNLVYSNYTLGVGPTTYNLNFISPAIENRDLINPMLYNSFDNYRDSFVINDIIKDIHNNVIYILYEVRAKITNSYKKTIILVLAKDIYDHSNFVEYDKVYEKNESKPHDSIITI